MKRYKIILPHLFKNSKVMLLILKNLLIVLWLMVLFQVFTGILKQKNAVKTLLILNFWKKE